MTVRFIGTRLHADEIGIAEGRVIHELTRELIWVNNNIVVRLPVMMQSDLASVPRVPVAWWLWGDRAHREGFLHDGLYRKDMLIEVYEHDLIIDMEAADNGEFVMAESCQFLFARNVKDRPEADWFFREAMIGRGQPWKVYHPMWWGVRMGGASSWHSKPMDYKYRIEENI